MCQQLIDVFYFAAIDEAVKSGGDLLKYFGRDRTKYFATRKCGKCPQCQFIITRPYCMLDGKKFVPNGCFDCSTNGVVYVITCSFPGCCAHYVGLTTNSLRMRLRSHLVCVLDGTDRKLYNHFRSHGADCLSYFNIEIILHIKNQDNDTWQKNLKSYEAIFIDKTRSPNSLNMISVYMITFY